MLIRDYSTIDLNRPVSDSPLNEGLVAWWMPLPNLYGGNRLWDLCGKNHGTLSNGPTWGIDRTGFGKLTYNGTNQQVDCGSIASLLNGQSYASLSVDFEIFSAATTATVGFSDSTNSRFQILHFSTISYFVVENGASAFATSSTNYSGRNLYRMDFSPGQIRAYRNGVELSLTPPSSTPSTLGTSGIFRIGRDQQNSLWGAQSVSSVRLYRGVRSSPAIARAEYESWIKGWKTPDSPLRWRRRTFFPPEQPASGGDISGTCSLSFASGSSALTGSGALAGAAANVFAAGSSNLSGSGSLAGVAANVFGEGSSSLVGSGSLAGTVANVFDDGSSVLVGGGSLTGSCVLVFDDGSSALTGSGVLAGSSANTFALSGSVASGAIAGSSSLVFGDGSSVLSGSGALAGVVASVFDDGSSVLSGAGGNLDGVIGILFGSGSSSLVGSGSLSGSVASVFDDGNSSLTGTGSLSGLSALVFDDGSSSLTGTGTLAGVVANVLTLNGTMALGSISGSVAIVFDDGSSILSGSGLLSGVVSNAFALSLNSGTPGLSDYVCDWRIAVPTLTRRVAITVTPTVRMVGGG